jgi:hypothetical protein
LKLSRVCYVAVTNAAVVGVARDARSHIIYGDHPRKPSPMKEEREPQRARSADELLGAHAPMLETSLTDLIDEMDRIAFRRALANRDLTRPLEITSYDFGTRPKSS